MLTSLDESADLLIHMLYFLDGKAGFNGEKCKFSLKLISNACYLCEFSLCLELNSVKFSPKFNQKLSI